MAEPQPEAAAPKKEPEAKTFSQGDLIDRMHKLGYPVKENGMCFGISHMAMQAKLAGELDVFIKRLQTFCDLPLEQFEPANVEQEIKKAAHAKKTHIEPQHYDSRAINRAIQHSTDANTWVDFKAFCDGVLLYHSSPIMNTLIDEFKVSATYQQDAEAVIHLAQPMALAKFGLDEKGKEITGFIKAAEISGIYTKNELAEFFHSLGQIKNLGDNYSIILGNTEHTINISFDQTLQKWVLIDPNKLPVRYFTNDETDKLAAEVFDSFGEADGKFCTFRSAFYTTKDKPDQSTAVEFQEKLKNWPEFSKFQKYSAGAPLEKSDIEKIGLIDTNGISWLAVAIKSNNLPLVKELLENGADPNQKLANGITLLYLAHNNPNITKLLLEYGADPNTEAKKMPLHGAVLHMQNDATQTLLEYGADPNKRDGDGHSPISNTSRDNNAGIKLLLEYGADPSVEDEVTKEMIVALDKKEDDPKIFRNYYQLKLQLAKLSPEQKFDFLKSLGKKDLERIIKNGHQLQLLLRDISDSNQKLELLQLLGKDYLNKIINNGYQLQSILNALVREDGDMIALLLASPSQYTVLELLGKEKLQKIVHNEYQLREILFTIGDQKFQTSFLKLLGPEHLLKLLLIAEQTPKSNEQEYEVNLLRKTILELVYNEIQKGLSEAKGAPEARSTQIDELLALLKDIKRLNLNKININEVWAKCETIINSMKEGQTKQHLSKFFSSQASEEKEELPNPGT